MGLVLHSPKEFWYSRERGNITVLQPVVEQLVDGAGSYGSRQLQRPEVKHIT